MASVCSGSVDRQPVGQNAQRLLLVLVALLVATFYTRQFALRLADPDLWGRMAVGRLILDEQAVPAIDIFAYTPTLGRWVDHEWLSGVVFYAIHQSTGEAGILLVKTALGLAAVALVLSRSLAGRASLLPTLALAAAMMPVFGYGLLPRSQLFTYFGFAGWLWLLERDRRGQSSGIAWLLPLTIIPWANLHGGFLAGLGLIALYAAGAWRQPRRVVRLASIGVLTAAATLINPYGVEYWSYLLHAVSMPRPGIREWDPVPLTIGYASFWLLWPLAIATAWRMRDEIRRDPTAAVVMLVTLVLASRHARHMPLAGLAVLTWAPAALWPKRTVSPTEATTSSGIAPRLAMAAVLLAAIAMQLYGLTVTDGPLRLHLPQTTSPVENMIVYPVGAVDYAVEHRVTGNLAVPFDWGEYAIWNLWPRCLVSLDGRYETAYPNATVEMVNRFFAGAPDWRNLLDRYATTHVLAPRTAPVNELLVRDPQWSVRFEDSVAILWQKRSRATIPAPFERDGRQPVL